VSGAFRFGKRRGAGQRKNRCAKQERIGDLVGKAEAKRLGDEGHPADPTLWSLSLAPSMHSV